MQCEKQHIFWSQDELKQKQQFNLLLKQKVGIDFPANRSFFNKMVIGSMHEFDQSLEPQKKNGTSRSNVYILCFYDN